MIGAISFRFAEDGRDHGDEERAFVATLAQQCAQALERAGVYEEQRRVAAALQESLLPRELPRVPGVALAVRYLPAAESLEVGGDWYEAVQLPGGRLALAVGDVVGRGLEAASVMGQLRSALRAFALIDDRPTRVLERLSAFAETVDGASVTTVAYLVLDPATGDARYACAGHPPPLVVDPDGSARFLDEGRAAPLATHGGVASEGALRLRPETTVLLFSDGAIERRGEVLDEGLERLAAVAARGPVAEPGALCDHLLAELFAKEPPTDDVALLALRILGAPVPAVAIEVPARPEQLARVRAAVSAWLGRLGASLEDTWDVLIACGEACANAIEHAYPARPAAGEGPTVRVELAQEGDSDVVVRVRDQGAWKPRRNPDLRGRGLLLMRKTMDAVTVQRSDAGTTVTLRRQLGDRATGARGEARRAPAPDAAGLAVEVRHARGPRPVIRLTGEIDGHTARALGPRLREASGEGLLGVVLDLSGVTYLDSAGMRVLLALARDCEETGRRLWVACPPGTPSRRVLELSGASVLLTIDDAPPEEGT
jgi:anti-anti-sigma factor